VGPCGAIAEIKKPGLSPAFKSPCLSTALFVALYR
jgi:hypothetical protein